MSDEPSPYTRGGGTDAVTTTVETEVWPMAAWTALGWSVIYVGIAFSDNRHLIELLGPINERIGDVASYALTLIPPTMTCGVLLATRGCAPSRVLKYVTLAAVLTAVGTTVGFFVLLFGGGAE